MTTTTLTADQSDDDVEASVAAAGPRESDFLIQIGDEYQYVEWRGDQFVHPWQVKRGFLGTLPVAHASGATVTVDPAIGGNGGGVSVDNGVDAPATVTTIVAPGATIEGDSATLLSTRLIGPFRVTHATPDLDEGAKLTDLAAGTIVLRLWAEITEDFGATLGVNVGPTDPGPPDDDYDLAVLYADGTSTSNPGRIGEHSPSGASPFGGWGSRIFRVLAPGGSLAAYVASPGATGIADVYAIIATAS